MFLGDYEDGYGGGGASQDPRVATGGYGGPTGVPDPYNPGYDTAGYPLPADATARTAPPVARGRTGVGQPSGSGDTVVPPPPPPGPIGGALANFSEPAPQFPNEPAYTPSTFTAPSFEDALSNPGYKFGVQQGRDSLENWAAARGTLNDSGTAKALIDYGENAGEQGYGEVYARNFNDWQANENASRQAYGLNRTSQYLDPWTAAYNAWTQRGNWYLQNQGTVANTALGFAQL